MKISSFLPLVFLALVPACASPVDDNADGEQSGKTSEAVTGVHSAIRDGQWHTFYWYLTASNPYCPKTGSVRAAVTYRAYGSRVDFNRIDVYNDGESTFTDGEIDGQVFYLFPQGVLSPYQNVTVRTINNGVYGQTNQRLPMAIPLTFGETDSSGLCDLGFNIVLT